MKQYPYIGQLYSAFSLFYEEGKGLLIGDALGLDDNSKVGDRINTSGGADVTQEYLSNTWGVVESKEHAEFIIELTELHGIKAMSGIPSDVNSFLVLSPGHIYFYKSNISDSFECDLVKQITIPLPPKDEPKAELPEAGHNLVFAAPECKEWPCVGDKAEYGSGVIVTVIATDGKYAWVSCRPSDRETPCTVKIAELQKPKTPEEALRDELHQLWDENNGEFDEFLDIAMENYNITPKD